MHNYKLQNAIKHKYLINCSVFFSKESTDSQCITEKLTGATSTQEQDEVTIEKNFKYHLINILNIYQIKLV